MPVLQPCHYFEHMSTDFLRIVVVRLADKPQSIRCQYAAVILVAEILLEFLVLRIFYLFHLYAFLMGCRITVFNFSGVTFLASLR